MNKYLEASIAAFNVSKNCDRSSPEAFYESYLSRKKLIISNKVSALKESKPVNQKKLDWEIFITEIAIKDKEDFLKRADQLLRSTSTRMPKKHTLERATKLVEELS